MLQSGTDSMWDGAHLYELLASIHTLSDPEIQKLVEQHHSNIPKELLEAGINPIICDSTGNCITDLKKLTIQPAWRLLGYDLASKPLFYKGIMLTPAMENGNIVSYTSSPDSEYSVLFQPIGRSDVTWELPVNYQLRRSSGKSKIISGKNKLLLKDAVRQYWDDIKKLGFID